MPNTYLEPTYKEVLCWKADTRIKYAPNPKRGKSFIRYAKYAKAKTVAEAMERGSKAIDLFFDFEHGFIKVVGGSRRAKPLDPKEEAEDWTAVDLMLAKMHRGWLTWKKTFAMAAKLGVDRRQLTANKVSGEATEVRAGRLAANELAKMVLEDCKKNKRKLTERDVVSVLRMWGFKENTSRGNVLPEGQTHVFSDTLGLVSNYKGYVSVSAATTEYASVTRVLTGWLKDHMPADFKANKFGFTSINVNANYAGRLHRDGNNEGPSLIKAFGDFTGGQLNYWGEDDKTKGTVESCCAPKDGTVVDLKSNLLMFDGNRGHCVSSFKGERFSLVYFSIGQYHKANKAVRASMESVGIDAPSQESLDKLKGMLGAPGSKCGKTKFRRWPVNDKKLGIDFTAAAQVKKAMDAAYKSDNTEDCECKDTKFIDSKLSYVILPDKRRGCRVYLTGTSGGQRLAVSGDEIKIGGGVYAFKKAAGFPKGSELSTTRLSEVREWVEKVTGKPMAAKAKRCISSKSASDAAPPAKRRRLLQGF